MKPLATCLAVLCLVACGGGGEKAALEKLQRESEKLRAQKAQLEAREKALEEQLKREAAEKEQSLQALEGAEAAKGVPHEERDALEAMRQRVLELEKKQMEAEQPE